MSGRPAIQRSRTGSESIRGNGRQLVKVDIKSGYPEKSEEHNALEFR